MLDQNDIYREKGVRINVYTMKPNLAGIEFVKNKVTRSRNYTRIIEILYGGAIDYFKDTEHLKTTRYTSLLLKKGKK